jgi:hypothetical protein
MIGVIVRQDGLHLLVDHLVGLAEQLAALGVADDHVLRRRAWPASRGRHLAGERALLLPVAVLGAEGDRDASLSSTVWTERMSVNGGCTDTSTTS